MADKAICGSGASFITDRRGNVAIIFALTLMAIMGATGAAVDFSRAMQVRSRLSAALDAAGLAAGKNIDATPEAITEIANAYFAANYPADELGVPGALVVGISERFVTLSATAEVDTTIMNIFGYEAMTVNASTEISREITGLEIVLALDNTGSMAGTKLENLKTASQTLINILFGTETLPANLKMGLVPFAAGVNVGTGFDTAWLDMAAQSSIHRENFNASTNLWTLYATMPNRDWNGCVQTRPEPLDELDTEPSLADPNTLFVPWFAPDEPNGSGIPSYPNSYFSDGVTGSVDVRQRATGKYTGTVSSTTRGPHRGCMGTLPITPLTNDRALLESQILAMTAADVTHIPIGLSWGWHVVSPGAPFTEGKPYDDEKNIKALVLMTDGENTISGNSTHNRSTYTAYGYLSRARLGTTSATTAVTRLDEKTRRVCENIKAMNIRLYTIAFQVTDPGTLDMLRDCASTEGMFFGTSDAAALDEAFTTIAIELSNLRISR